MYCKQCGSKINDGEKYCKNCGNKVESEYITNNIDSNKNDNTVVKIIGIIAIVLVIFGIIFCILVKFMINNSKDIFSDMFNSAEKVIDKAKDSVKKESVNKVSIEYSDIIWKLDEVASNDEKKVLNNGNNVIQLAYSKSPIYINTYTFVTEQERSLKEKGYTIIKEREEVEINNIKWMNIEYIKSGVKYMQLLYSTGYETYSFTLMSPEDTFDLGKVYAITVYKTLKYDDTELKEGERQAKKELTGEWDCNKFGYFVFDENNIYFYENSTKSMDNVIYGTYTANNKIATNANGYIDGYYFVLNAEGFYIDGEEQNITNEQSEFALTKSSDNNYNIKNITTGNTGVCKKVK